MSAAGSSLIEIDLAAVCRTGTRVPWDDRPEGTQARVARALSALVTVSCWFQDTRPAAIWWASAPRTNILNIDPRGRAAEGSHLVHRDTDPSM